jgi:hypothetical protein
LLKKYAASKVILPPPPEEEMIVKVPVEGDEIPREWTELEDFDPLTEKPTQSQEELLEMVQEDPLAVGNPEVNIGGDMPTVPPPKKKANLSPDKLLALCTRYYELAKF